MSMGATQLVPCTATKTLACINSDQFSGVLYNPYLKCPMQFDGAVQFTKILDELFNSICFPQAHTEDRTFTQVTKTRQQRSLMKATKYNDDDIITSEKGRIATFLIQVRFRHNSTWQGTVIWSEQKKTCNFSSALELLMMMDQVVSPEFNNQQWSS